MSDVFISPRAKNGPQNIFRQDMKVSMEPKWISPWKSSDERMNIEIGRRKETERKNFHFDAENLIWKIFSANPQVIDLYQTNKLSGLLHIDMESLSEIFFLFTRCSSRRSIRGEKIGKF